MKDPLLEVMVEIAFSTGPYSLAPVYVDVTDRVVRSVRKRGRQDELARDEISTVELTLRNRDRALDPTYTASPFSPNVKPRRRVRMRMRLGGTTIYPYFDGYTGKWPWEQEGAHHSDITVNVRDAFDLIQRAKVSGDFPDERVSDRVVRVLDLIGWPVSRRQIFTSQSVMQAELVDRANALDYLRECAETESGRIFVSAAGDVTFHDRHRRLLAYGTAAAIYGDSPAGGTEIPYTDVRRQPDDDKIRNEIIGQRPGGPVFIANDATSENEYGLATLSVSPKLYSDTEVETLVSGLLRDYKDPKTRFESLSISANMDNRVPLRVLTDELSTRLTIRQRPLGIGAMLEQAVHIERVSDEFAQPKTGFYWKIDYETSLAETLGYWILGTSALGTGTRLTY